MKKTVLAVMIVFMPLAFAMTTTTVLADELPQGIIIVNDSKYPISCMMLGDGSLVVSGFEASSADVDIDECLFLAGEPMEDRESKPLAGYIAMYTPDGVERWSHRLPCDREYKAVYLKLLHNDLILCTVQPYVRRYGFNPKTVIYTFLLDKDGNQVAMPEWLNEAFYEETLMWWVTIPDGSIMRNKLPMELPALYTPTLTRYDTNMKMVWQSTPDELANYLTLALFPANGAYIGYAVDICGMESQWLTTHRPVVYKLDDRGNFLWKYPLVKGARITSLVPTLDGGVYAFGANGESDPGEKPITFAIHLDGDGKAQWVNDEYFENYGITLFFGLEPTKNGYYYLMGRKEVTDDIRERIVIRFDSQVEYLQFMCVPQMGWRAEDLEDLVSDGHENVYYIGTLDNQHHRWYILPLTESLFSNVW